MRFVRRLIILGGLVLLVRFLVQRRADQNVEHVPTPAGDDQWPPLQEPTTGGAEARTVEPVDAPLTDDTPTDDSPTDDTPLDRSVDAEPAADAEPGADDTVVLERPMPVWVVPEDGVCPISHPIKLNRLSGIFHVPGGRFYDRTIPERCYASAEDAVADGYRAAKA